MSGICLGLRVAEDRIRDKTGTWGIELGCRRDSDLGAGSAHL